MSKFKNNPPKQAAEEVYFGFPEIEFVQQFEELKRAEKRLRNLREPVEGDDLIKYSLGLKKIIGDLNKLFVSGATSYEERRKILEEVDFV